MKLRFISRFSLILLIFMTLSSCTLTRVAVILPENDDEIELYTTQTPERDYVEVCYIESIGGIFRTPQNLLDKLKKRGQELGADAIINIRYDFRGFQPVASGTLIVYQ